MRADDRIRIFFGSFANQGYSSQLRVVEHAFVVVALSYVVVKGIAMVRERGALRSLSGLVFSAARTIPGVSKAIDGAINVAIQPMVDELVPPDETAVVVLPEAGIDKVSLCARLSDMAQRDFASFAGGKQFGGIYHANVGDLIDVQNAAMASFNATNALYPGQFTAVRKMEAEVIAMAVSLLKGTNRSVDPAPEACGLLTTGGTESILLAIKAYRDMALASGRLAPLKVVAGITAHPALDKACEFFGLQLVKLPVDPLTQELGVESIRRVLDRSVACVYASAPTFSHGTIDPIPAISALCAGAGVPLHVDNCLGGVLYSAAVAEGLKWRDFSPSGLGALQPLPAFDFSLPGVTSVSIDVHKYGNAPKGASVVAFRTPGLRAHCYTMVTDWPGGLYATPTMTGSRGGASIAAAWATMRFTGASGYRAMARRTHELHQRLVSAIAQTPGLTILGRPMLAVLAFTASQGSGRNIYALSARMQERGGWHLNEIQSPAGLALCVSERFGVCIDAFLEDLAACAAEWVADPANPKYLGKGAAGIYGAAVILPPGEVSGLLRGYCDALTLVRPAKSAAAR